ncbi:MAG: hypothetical protein ACO38I_05570 [Ilumatobacteraceae bacterium]
MATTPLINDAIAKGVQAVKESKEAARKLSSHIANKPREKWMIKGNDTTRALTWMLTPDNLLKDMVANDKGDKLLKNHQNFVKFVGSLTESTGEPEGTPPTFKDLQKVLYSLNKDKKYESQVLLHALHPVAGQLVYPGLYLGKGYSVAAAAGPWISARREAGWSAREKTTRRLLKMAQRGAKTYVALKMSYAFVIKQVCMIFRICLYMIQNPIKISIFAFVALIGTYMRILDDMKATWPVKIAYECMDLILPYILPKPVMVLVRAFRTFAIASSKSLGLILEVFKKPVIAGVNAVAYAFEVSVTYASNVNENHIYFLRTMAEAIAKSTGIQIIVLLSTASLLVADAKISAFSKQVISEEEHNPFEDDEDSVYEYEPHETTNSAYGSGVRGAPAARPALGPRGDSD